MSPRFFLALGAFILATALFDSRAQEFLFGPGVLDRVVLVVETAGSSFSGTKTTNTIAPDQTFEIKDSTFPNGQSFKAGQPLLNGSLKFNFPAVTPVRDVNGLFQPPMPASVTFDGAWSKTGNSSYGAARLTMTSIQPTACPNPATGRVKIAPIPVGTSPASVSAACDLKSLSSTGGSGVEQEQYAFVVFEAITGDGGPGLNDPVFLGASGTVAAYVFYKSPRRPEISLARPNPLNTLTFAHTDGEPLPPAQTVTFTNIGGLPLNWTVTTTNTSGGGVPAWLKIASTNGTSPSLAAQALELSVDTTGLKGGNYSATVTIGGNTWNGSKTFQVNLNFTGKPRPTVTPGSLEFTNTVLFPRQDMIVMNEGSAPVTPELEVTSESNWLDAPKFLGTLNPGEARTITVKASRFPAPTFTELPPGDYTGKIVIKPAAGQPAASDFPPITVNAIFHIVAPKDELTLNAAGAVPAPETSLLRLMKTNFSAEVSYTLNSVSEADLALRVFDQNGVLQATSVDPANTNRLLQVRRSDGKKTLRLTTGSFVIPADASNLLLKAVLINASTATVLKETEPITYPISAGAIRSFDLGAYVTLGFGRYLKTPIWEAGVTMPKQPNPALRLRSGAQVTYDFLGKDGRVRLTAEPKLADGRPAGGRTGISPWDPFQPGIDQTALFYDTLEVPGGADVIEYYAELVEVRGEDDPEFVIDRSERLPIFVNRIEPVKEQMKPALESEVTAGETFNFSVPTEVTFKGPEASRQMVFRALAYLKPPSFNSGKPTRQLSTTVLETIPAESADVRFPSLDVMVPPDATAMAIQLSLDGDPKPDFSWAQSAMFYYHVKSPPLKIQAGSGQSFSFSGATLNQISSSSAQVVTPHSGFEDLKSLLPASSNSPAAVAPTRAKNIAAQALSGDDPNSPFISIGDYLRFDPAIPENGTFSGNLVLRYVPENFPDDPNFNESKIEIISFDPASGVFRRHSTELNPAAQTAATAVSGLAPYYSLAVFGPFTHAVLNLPATRSPSAQLAALTSVNPSDAVANFEVRAESGAGSEFVTNAEVAVIRQTLPPGSSFALSGTEALSTNGAWVQVRADQPAGLVWQLFENAERREALAASDLRTTALILIDVEHGTNVTTEIHLANTTPFRNVVKLEAFDEQGQLFAAAEVSLAPKQKVTRTIPDLAKATNQITFKGYVIARGSQELAAADLRITRSSLEALNAQALSDASTKLFAPRFSAGGRFASHLVVVNPNPAPVSVALHALDDSGKDLAPVVNLPLGNGKTLRTNLAQMFGLNNATETTGSITVESSRGVLGSISLRDAAGADACGSSFPLEHRSSARFLMAQLESGTNRFTEISFANPNAASAHVTVSVVKTNGANGGTASLAIPAGGRATRTLATLIDPAAIAGGASLLLEASDPIFVSGLAGDNSLNMLSTVPLMALLVSQPELAVSLNGLQLTASWPAAATGFSLQSTPSLAPPVSWSPVATPATVTADRNTVALNLSEAMRFYRLAKP